MPTNFVIGQILMLLARPEIEARSQESWTPPLKLALLYSACIFVPLTAWAFYSHTAWSTVYLRPPERIPSWSGPLIVSLYFVGMFFGALLAHTLLQLKRIKLVYLTLGVSVFWLVVVWGLTFDEYLHVGTFVQYMSGQAVPMTQDAVFQRDMNIMGAGLAIPAIGLAFYLRQRSQKYLRLQK